MITKAQLNEAQDWIGHKFRGSTIYDGHPIDVLNKLFDLILSNEYILIKKEVTEKMLKSGTSFDCSGMTAEDYIYDAFNAMLQAAEPVIGE